MELDGTTLKCGLGPPCAGPFHGVPAFFGCRGGLFGLRRRFVSLFFGLDGFRYGEALRPGPRSAAVAPVITFAVINPTTILDKEWQVSQVSADVIIASETSANARVQRIMVF